ncbi:MAG: nucleoside-diphosphate kinase [Planctomycetia bacterium]|nr:nucleoside-diphosphate kinase [Planctomycetia bacterium]
MQRTLILLKPDCVQRRLIGTILSRIEQKGFYIAGLKWIHITEELAAKHYADHVSKEFYPKLLEYITSGPSVAAVVEGPEVIATIRKLTGSTNGLSAEPGTIRGDFSVSTQRNLIHASDSQASAEREISIFFQENEIFSSNHADKMIIFNDQEREVL